MAKDPHEQRPTEAERIPEQGPGTLDQDLDEIVERERERQTRPDHSSAPPPPPAR